MNTPPLARHVRLTGEARRKASEQLAARYRAGESIRELAAGTGYSITRTRSLLTEAGVEFRARGGAHPRAKTGD